jgi:hypothetical protein
MATDWLMCSARLRLLGGSGRLTAVDPYGDTLMNEQEAAAARYSGSRW